MKAANFTIIYWNTWYEMQNGKRDDGTLVCGKLDALIKNYSPAVFGLNEVFVHANGRSPVNDYLMSINYHIHFVPIVTLQNGSMIGSTFASKHKPTKVVDHILAGETPSNTKWYKDYKAQLIETELRIGDCRVTILVNHLRVLIMKDWRVHIKQRKSYEAIVKNIENTNLIIGGDFNETKYMLPWWRTPKHLKRKTGSFYNPTWRPNGKKRLLLFANYDHMLYAANGRLTLKQFSVLGRRPSDHAPLLGQFEIST